MRQYSLLKKKDSSQQAFLNPLTRSLDAVLTSCLFSLAFLVPLIGSFWYLPLLSLEDLENFHHYFLRPALLTIILGVSVSLLALVWAIGALFSLEFVHKRVRNLLLLFTPLPLIFPPYIGAITYMDIFKSQIVLGFFGRSDLVEFLQATFVLSLFLYPYIFLLISNRMKLMNPHHMNIISLHNLTFFERIRILYIPHLKYAAASGMLLVFLYTISDFGAVSILRMDTLTIQIYYEFVTRFNRPEASLIATSFVLISAGALYITQHLGKKGMLYKSSNSNKALYQNRKNNLIAIVFLLLLLSLSIAVPLIKILTWLYQYAIDTSAFKDVWLTAKEPLSLVSVTTLGIAGFITLLSLGSTFFYYAFIKQKNIVQSVPFFLAMILHTLPGIVIAFGVTTIKYFFDVSFLLSWIFFLSGYVFRYTGIAFVTIEPAIRSIPYNFVRLGDVFIKSKFAFISLIVFPLIKTHVISGAAFIFFNTIRDLAIPLVLLPLGIEVLSVRIWQTAGEGMYIYASPAIVVLLLLSLVPVILFVRNNL